MADPRYDDVPAWTNQELLDKVDHEGGWSEALDWGIARVRLQDPDAAAMLFEVKELHKAFAAAAYTLDNYLVRSLEDNE